MFLKPVLGSPSDIPLPPTEPSEFDYLLGSVLDALKDDDIRSVAGKRFEAKIREIVREEIERQGADECESRSSVAE